MTKLLFLNCKIYRKEIIISTYWFINGELKLTIYKIENIGCVNLKPYQPSKNPFNVHIMFIEKRDLVNSYSTVFSTV